MDSKHALLVHGDDSSHVHKPSPINARILLVFGAVLLVVTASVALVTYYTRGTSLVSVTPDGTPCPPVVPPPVGPPPIAPADVIFGANMRQYFMLADGYYDLNHGSYGATPREVSDAQRNYTAQMEAKPDRWFRGLYQAHLAETRPILANYIGAASANDVVFIENASSGVNAVLRSLKFNPGETIIYFSTAYGMVKSVVGYLAQRYGLNVIEMPVIFPTTQGGTGPPDFVGLLTQTLAANNANHTVKMAVFSHMTSLPAVILPVIQLAQICEAAGITLFIDGAHAMGQIPVNVTEMGLAGVDYYLSNGHKWLYSPKGSAVLWVNPTINNLTNPSIVPSVISFAHDFQGEFEYTGTRDYTAFCSMKDAIAFRQRLGDARIMQYGHDLAVWAGTYLSNLWGTQVLVPSENIGFMIDVRLPDGDASTLWQTLWTEYDMDAPVYAMAGVTPTQWWVRLSAQIYVSQQDFQDFGAAVNKVMGVAKR